LLRKESPDDSPFFVQQCAEKLLRAVLEQEGVTAGKTHSLDELASLLPPEHRWRAPFLAFDRISSAATRYRYPTQAGNILHVDEGDLDRDITTAETLFRDVSAWLSFRLT
jgi:HEPN domain-containing protein